MADKNSAITLAKQGKPNEPQKPKKQENSEAQGAPTAQKITNRQSGKPKKQEDSEAQDAPTAQQITNPQPGKIKKQEYSKPQVGLTAEQITNRKSSTPRTKVYLLIKIGRQPAEKIVIELFKDTAPNTAGEFERLCQDGVYRNSTFHEVHGYTCHAGRDIDGVLQENRPLFHEGEVLKRPPGIPSSTPHDYRRILCIPRDTTGGRGREFIICRAADSTIYAAHVVAGELIDNSYDVLRKIESSLGSTTTAANSQDTPALPGPSTASATTTATAATGTTTTAAATIQGAAARPGPSTASLTRPTVLIQECGVMVINS